MTARQIEMNRRLKNAVAAFVANDCGRGAMDVPRWAAELECGVEDVRAAWEAEMTRHSQRASDQYGEGK